MKWLNKHIFLQIALTTFLASFPVQSQSLSRNTAIVLRQTAQMYERVGQVKQAAEYYARACRENPADISAYLGAKRMFLRAGDYAAFENLILTLQKRRRDIRYLVDLGLVEFQRGNEKQALEKWHRVLEENANQQAYSLVGQALVDNQLYDEAIQVYASGRRVLKNKTAFMFELAGIYKVQEKYQQLLTEYAEYLVVNPVQINFIESEVQRFAREEESRAEPLIKQTKKLMKNYPSVEWALHIILGDLYVFEKQFSTALEHYLSAERQIVRLEEKRIKKSNPNGRFLFNLGEQALKSNAHFEAENAFRVLIDEFPDSQFRAKAELRITRVYLLRGANDKAIASLESFIQNNKKSLDVHRAMVMIGDIYFADLKLDRARTAYKRAYIEFPNNRLQTEILFKLADCAVADDSLQQARTYLRQAINQSQAYPELTKRAFLALARVAFYQGRPQSSLAALQEFSGVRLKQGPDMLENDALELMMLLQENSHDSTSLAVLGKARRLGFQRRYEQAAEEIKSYLEKHPDVLLRSELQMELATALKMQQKYEPALTALLAVYEDQESLTRDGALMAAAQILEENLSNSDLARERYETLLEEFPHSVYLDEARARIRNLRKRKENF